MPYPVKVDVWTLTGATAQNHSDSAPTAGTKNGTTVTSAEFDKIPIAGAATISVQCSDATGTSTSITVEVMTSSDNGTTWDSASHPYSPMNYDASTDAVKSFAVTPGPTHMRIRTSEGNVAGVVTTINVAVTWE